jgi:hypothetical protein
MELLTSEGRNLGLHQMLEAPAQNLMDQGGSDVALHELAQLAGATMGEVHDLCSVWW